MISSYSHVISFLWLFTPLSALLSGSPCSRRTFAPFLPAPSIPRTTLCPPFCIRASIKVKVPSEDSIHRSPFHRLSLPFSAEINICPCSVLQLLLRLVSIVLICRLFLQKYPCHRFQNKVYCLPLLKCPSSCLSIFHHHIRKCQIVELLLIRIFRVIFHVAKNFRTLLLSLLSVLLDPLIFGNQVFKLIDLRSLMVQIEGCKVHLTESSRDQLRQCWREMSLQRKEVKSGAIYVRSSRICIDYVSGELVISTIFIRIHRAGCNRYVCSHLVEFILDFQHHLLLSFTTRLLLHQRIVQT